MKPWTKHFVVLCLFVSSAACSGQDDEEVPRVIDESYQNANSSNNGSVPDSTNNGVPGNNSSIDNGGTNNASTNNENSANSTNNGTQQGVDTSLVPRRWAPQQGYTHDSDRDLARVLEVDRLNGACDRWRAGDRSEETKYLCGKWMFFYETFGTVGIPKDILKFSQKWYVGYYGIGFKNFGFVSDPSSSDGMPIGLAPTTGKLGNLETRAFTCAGCHFGKMPDGRYAAGYGNLQLDYGRFIAGLGAPLSLSMNANDPSVHPQIKAELGGHVAQAKQNSTYMIELGILGLSLLSASQDSLPDADEQAAYMALRPGTMDFLTPPMVDDEQWTVSRILPLWNIPNAEQRAEVGMDHERLSWTGGAKTLDGFISGFVAIGVSDTAAWGPEQIEPLKAYVQGLRVPELETQLSPMMVERGAEVFVEAGCLDCHDGPSGETTLPYSFAEVGTDGAMEFIFNPDENDVLCCGFDDGDGPEESYEVTRGVKGPRMTGLENQTKFLHNGSVDSLAQLLCMQARPVDTNPAQGSGGHTYGCDLPEADRTALVFYLNSL